MVASADFEIFAKYKNASGHAFSNNLVTEADKDKYQNIFGSLLGAANSAISQPPYSDYFKVWNTRFYRDGGVQGQRPVDLWAAVINAESDVLARYPQVYAIASEAGIELGFGVAIHESDYYNAEIKRRNRAIVPVLYNKLPNPDSELIQNLEAQLNSEQGWLYGLKTRQGPLGSFQSLSEMIKFLKSGESSVQGGGAVYRMIVPARFDDHNFWLEVEYAKAIRVFTPLMRAMTPSGAEEVRLADQEEVDKAARALSQFDPANIEDGRKKILQAVAVRQGQAKFREKLLEAYESRCAITGTGVPVTLQAAHIVPYRGPETNAVQNGVLLRADIHNLFDMGLITIEPETYLVTVARELSNTAFAKLNGRILRKPAKRADWPSSAALSERAKLFTKGEA